MQYLEVATMYLYICWLFKLVIDVLQQAVNTIFEINVKLLCW